MFDSVGVIGVQVGDKNLAFFSALFEKEVVFSLMNILSVFVKKNQMTLIM